MSTAEQLQAQWAKDGRHTFETSSVGVLLGSAANNSATKGVFTSVNAELTCCMPAKPSRKVTLNQLIKTQYG